MNLHSVSSTRQTQVQRDIQSGGHPGAIGHTTATVMSDLRRQVGVAFCQNTSRSPPQGPESA